MDLGGREGSGRGWGGGMPWLIGWEVSGVGRRDGCLLGGGEGVRGEVVFALLGSRESQNYSSTREYRITEKQEKAQIRNKDNIN